MAKYSANGATITLTVTGSAHNVGPDCESYEIRETRILAEASGFGEHENYLQGQEMYEVDLEAWFGVSGTAAGIFNVLRITKANQIPITVSIKPESTTLTFSGTFVHEGFSVSGAKKGETIKLGTVTFKAANGYAKPSWS